MSHKHRVREGCDCGLCVPDGRKVHPVYGYELDKVHAMCCVNCSELIGEDAYVEEPGMARFGDMRFIHIRCETDKQAKSRKRIEKRWVNKQGE